MAQYADGEKATSSSTVAPPADSKPVAGNRAVLNGNRNRAEIPSILTGQPTPSAPTPAVRTPAVQTNTAAQVQTNRPSQPLAQPARSAAPPQMPQRTEQVTASSRPVEVSRGTGNPVSMASRSPLVSVQTTGPNTIGVGKPGTYEIVVTNGGAVPAGGVVVSFEVPDHIELADTSVSSGATEFANDSGTTQVVWTIDSVNTNTQQKMAVKVVPQKAIGFDMQVDWRFVPITGSAHVQVTEPRLGMEITGPSEVKYGEKGVYTITVINSGTGDAEGVLVSLSEMLGGEQASVGVIQAGSQKQFEVELVAREAGELELGASVSAQGGLRENAAKKIVVRRARLAVKASGPAFKYAADEAVYMITVSNIGDTAATNVLGATALPIGADYIDGIDGGDYVEGGDGLRWNIGTLAPNAERTYKIRCRLNTAGKVRLEAGVRGDTELAAADVVQTEVEALADLTLTVRDPRGPQKTAAEVEYEIVVKNRGTKEARDVKISGQFSPGIEPVRASGSRSEIFEGQVIFDAIPAIRVGQEIVLKVRAKADKSGTHIFRAELNCAEQDIRRVSEGTPKFFDMNSRERIAEKPSTELKLPSSTNR